MTRTKRTHVVPACLQSNWGDNVWVYDKLRDKKFENNVQNTMVNKHFYKPSVETKLAEIEGMCNPIIKKILKTKTLIGLTQEDYLILSAYIHAQFSRTYMMRKGIKDMSDQIEEHIIGMGLDPKQVSNFNPLTDNEVKEMSYDFLFNPQVAFSIWPNKKWILLEAPDDYSFWIGDNPVVWSNSVDMGPYGNLGLAVFGVELYMPLSPKYSLLLMCPLHYQQIVKSIKGTPDLKKLIKQNRFDFRFNKKIVKEANLHLKQLSEADRRLKRFKKKIDKGK
ncbi:hypothetical protein LCGC14_1060000 [marine sediment metagenome]|uniref:DUF4238 domain-containing protein n=1 Tax=marine sediment metagenome TaxID=412755 RepID=A0A0F9MLI1_9ZZZZ